MTKWEYLSFTIRYDRKLKNWTILRADQTPIVGLQAILNVYGAEGWELVHLLPEQSEAYPGFGKWTIDAEAYRATFKRPAG
jgi:hypothetical protein